MMNSTKFEYNNHTMGIENWQTWMKSILQIQIQIKLMIAFWFTQVK